MRELPTRYQQATVQAVLACGTSHFVIRTSYFVLQHTFGTDAHSPSMLKQLKLAA